MAMPVIRRRALIRNQRGLHARASARLVRCAELFEAEIMVSRDGENVIATSIMGLMMLAAGPGSELEISATGPESAAAVDALCELIESGFHEDS